MDAFLVLSPSERGKHCFEAAGSFGLAAVSFEKDFWVTWALRELFALPGWGEQLAFKGGTSLAKAWKLIKRFSEDVDVVIERSFLGFAGERLSQKPLGKLRETCQRRIREELRPALQERIARALPAGEVWSLELAATDLDPDQQTLLFHYPRAIVERSTYVTPSVRIEFGARSETEPAERPNVQPFLAEVFPDLFEGGAFSLRTVAARRTFWEKAMLVHEETYRPESKARKPRLARHYYDLACLIQRGVAREAVEDVGLFERVAVHRLIFFPHGWMDYSTLRKGALRLVPPESQLDFWRRDYQAMRANMFYGEPPAWTEILATVARFEREFNAG